MLKKDCPECKKTSYSATAVGDWTCPYCGNVLNKVKEEPVIQKKSSRQKVGGIFKCNGSLTVTRAE